MATAISILTALSPLLISVLQQMVPTLVPAILKGLLTPYSSSDDFSAGLDKALITGDTSKLAYYTSLAVKNDNKLTSKQLIDMQKLIK